MRHVYADPRVRLLTGALATALEVSGGDAVTAVRYRRDGGERVARGDLVVLGANAVFNPHLLLRSGIPDGHAGRGLTEQVSRNVTVHLDGLDHFGGSTMVTGLGYMLHDRDRAATAAALIESHNSPLRLRPERGRWRQVAHLRVIFEDHPHAGSAVGFDDSAPDLPTVRFAGRSRPALAALASLEADLERVLAPLPVERIQLAERPNPTEAHIQCTTPMGTDPVDSVVDRHLVHHRLRNLAVLGSGAFPTAAPANPTLTICALSLRFADHVGARGGAGRRASGSSP
jgi:choline dehydrogenase-like flavoprotein